MQIFLWNGKLYVSILTKFTREIDPHIFCNQERNAFLLGRRATKAFDEIKYDVTHAPVLLMPNSKGHFFLVSDTSKVGCGAALYQKQRGRYHLVAYYSKRLPEAVANYSISELELTGVMANVAAFKHLLRNANFHVYCDILKVMTRRMSKSKKADVPAIYPLKGEHKKPEHVKPPPVVEPKVEETAELSRPTCQIVSDMAELPAIQEMPLQAVPIKVYEQPFSGYPMNRQ